MTLRAIHTVAENASGEPEWMAAFVLTRNIACNTLPCAFTRMGLLPLSRDVDADGDRERDRDSERRGPGALRQASARARRCRTWTGRARPTPNAAERALRGIALGRNCGCSLAPIAAACGRRAFTASSSQVERRRSAGVARRRARPHRRSSCASPRRTHALELGGRTGA